MKSHAAPAGPFSASLSSRAWGGGTATTIVASSHSRRRASRRMSRKSSRSRHAGHRAGVLPSPTILRHQPRQQRQETGRAVPLRRRPSQRGAHRPRHDRRTHGEPAVQQQVNVRRGHGQSGRPTARRSVVRPNVRPPSARPSVCPSVRSSVRLSVRPTGRSQSSGRVGRLTSHLSALPRRL